MASAEFGLHGHLHKAGTTSSDERIFRQKNGMCPNCGMQTHQVKGSWRGKKLKPLTNSEVNNGRCLQCHPPASSNAVAPPHPSAAASVSVPSPAPYVVPQHASASHAPSAPALPSRPPSTNAPSSAVGTAASSPPSVSSSEAMAASSQPRGKRFNDDLWGWGTYIGEINGRGERHGWGTMKWDDGSEYEGEWKDGEMDGRGTFRYSDGVVDVSRHRAGDWVGEGVVWSADRRTARLTEDGHYNKNISLRKAEEVAERIGLPVPK